jgi:Ca-activated chloride channel homolog
MRAAMKSNRSPKTIRTSQIICTLMTAVLSLTACSRSSAPAPYSESAPATSQVPSDFKADNTLEKNEDKDDKFQKRSGGVRRPGAPMESPKLKGRAEAQRARPPSPPFGGGLGTGAGTMGDDKPKVQETIDPNGRFATTYRPGAGHLAAFESAIARGIVPPGEREVVANIGARYTPDFEVPSGKALALKSALERTSLSPNGGTFHLRVALKSADIKPKTQPHLSVHLVLDTSGSMAGDFIANAKKAAESVVDKLKPTDDFSLATFSSEAQLLVKDGPIGSRKEAIKKIIRGIKEGGGTNIGAGLQLAYNECKTKSIPKDAARVVLLLSDGRANSGIIDRKSLSKLALDAFQDGIQTSTFGLGSDYDGPLMSSIANDGAGGYYYLRDSTQISSALDTEMKKRLDPIATVVEVRVRLKKGVDLLNVYGSRRLSASESAVIRSQEVSADNHAQKVLGIKKDREHEDKSGMRFFIPAFARNEGHSILLKLRMPAGTGTKPVALIELKYKDQVNKKNVSDETSVSIKYANSDADSAATSDASVQRTIQGFAAGDTLANAANLIANNQRAQAVALLQEREGLLRTAAKVLNEPLFEQDAVRIARLRSHAASTTDLGDPLVLAMLLETASNARLR